MATSPSHSQRNQQPEGDAAGRKSEHHFISYSRLDSVFVKRLKDELQNGQPRFKVWVDQSEMRPGPWPKQLEEAIDSCRSFLLVVSEESNKSPDVAKELHRATVDDKPIIPLILESQAKVPYLVADYQSVYFLRDGDFGKSLAQLQKLLKELKPQKTVKKQEPLHQTLLTTPTIINDPPLIAPAYFQGRDEQYQLIEEFLSDDSRALLWISGRAGSGKTALVCRVLDHIRRGIWVSPERTVPIHAIAYLNRKHHSESDWINVLDDLHRSLPPVPDRNPQERHLTAVVENLLSSLSDRHVVLFVDHLDALIDPKTRNLTDLNLWGAIEAVLTGTTHRLKVIATSRILPLNLPMAEQARWRTSNLATGLPQPEATQLFRDLDHDGTVGLRDGSDTLLMELCRRTQGNPLAIETLHARFGNDLAISPIDVLRDENRFLPDEVLDVLIGKSYAYLDDVSKTMMQVLSASETPVTVDAVVSVFHHYHKDIDPRQVLNRLVNMQLVQKTNECYLLREADQRYVASQLTDGVSSVEGGPERVHLDRFTLYKHHADYLRRASASDLPGSVTRQLEEFHHRYKGKDYADAVNVLKRLETPLLALERGQELAQYYEQLAGKLEDGNLVRHQLDTLARIYHRVGKLDRATSYYEEGLKCVRDASDSSGECHYLANLAICKQESGDLVVTTLYCMTALELARQTRDGAWEAHIWNVIGEVLASLGRISDAVQASERALELARNSLQRDIEVVALVNLGQHYEALDKVDHAQDECDRACRIAKAIGFQLGESAARRNLGILELGRRRYTPASKNLAEAMRLADATQSAQLQQTTRIELATALLLDGKLSEASATADEALRYDTPLFSLEAHALRGVIRQRQGKAHKAAESFFSALEQAQVVVKRTSRYYRGLDAMGLSYSGLVLLESEQYLEDAIDAYEAARLIANEPGIVRRRLQLFEALVKADSGGKLDSVRNAID